MRVPSTTRSLKATAPAIVPEDEHAPSARRGGRVHQLDDRSGTRSRDHEIVDTAQVKATTGPPGTVTRNAIRAGRKRMPPLPWATASSIATWITARSMRGPVAGRTEVLHVVHVGTAYRREERTEPTDDEGNLADSHRRTGDGDGPGPSRLRDAHFHLGSRELIELLEHREDHGVAPNQPPRVGLRLHSAEQEIRTAPMKISGTFVLIFTLLSPAFTHQLASNEPAGMSAVPPRSPRAARSDGRAWHADAEQARGTGSARLVLVVNDRHMLSRRSNTREAAHSSSSEV